MTPTLEQIAVQTADECAKIANDVASEGATFINGTALQEIILTALQTATAQHEEDRDRHLRRLYSWARQDPTGPWEKDEIKSWVLNELCGAMGKSTRPLEWEPESLRANQKVPTAQHAPTQGGDWAEAAAMEIRQTHYAFNPDVQMVGPLAAIIRRHAPQPDLASVHDAAFLAVQKVLTAEGLFTFSLTERLVSALTPLLGANEDRERLDWLEKTNWCAYPAPAYDGNNAALNQGDATIEAKSLRDAIDAARHSAPKEGGAQ